MPELPYSFLYYLLLLALLGGVLVSVPLGGLFFLKRSGVKRANYFYGLLLMAIGLTLLHNVLIITEFYSDHPQYKFFPIYLTLSFPTLLFYYVKLNLYPHYQLRLTDIKHFILPVGQWLYFWFIFLNTPTFKLHTDRHFYNPFYGGMEQALYLTTFLAYLYFARRYIVQRRAKRLPTEVRKIWYLDKLVKGLFILFVIHTTFVLIDFFSFEFLRINLRAVKPYAAMGALSFAALVYWLSVYGFQVLIWSRKVWRARGKM